MLDINDTAIICIDLQEKLVKMLNSDVVANNVAKLMTASSFLGIDTIITEQYPRGLGVTLDSIKSIKEFNIIEKTSFSALRTLEFKKAFKKLKKKNVIVFGIETHICVYQTVCDLLDKKYNVYVPADCCASRNEFNYKIGIDLMRQKGAFITSLETILFEFLLNSHHPNFKEVQALIK